MAEKRERSNAETDPPDHTDQPLEHAIESIEDVADGETVSLGALLDSFEDRSLGFILSVFGLLNALPVIGAIPFLPNVSAVVILATVFHSFAGGRTHFMAPARLRRQEISSAKVDRMLERVRPIGEWVDARLGDRAKLLVEGDVARAAIALVCAGLAVAMVVLSLVPGLASVPALGIMLFGLALMGRDGLVALIGYGFAGGSAVALVYLWQTAL